MTRLIPLVAFIPVVAVGACDSSNNGPADSGTPKPVEAGVIADATTDAAPPPPAAGGTGAFGIVTINGKQKMYLPQTAMNAAGHPFIAVVDVGATGNGATGAPALITTVDLGVNDSGSDFEYATATGGDSSIVVAVSTQFPEVWFIDPNTDTLVNTLTLDTTMFGSSSFSGGGGYVTGVAIDSANHRAILSVWNGFALVDLTTQTITTVIQAPPSENFGFDSTHERIIAPFYDCSSSTLGSTTPSSCATPKAADGTPITDGLSIIDLTDNSVYNYLDPAVDGGAYAFEGPTPNTPVGGEPDSAAADPTTGVIVIPSEGDGFQSIIDLSQATFTKSTLTVTAPQRVVESFPLTGVAVEPNSHFAFWEEEHGNDVAVASLTELNLGSQSWVHGTMPDLPVDEAGNGGGGFGNIGDPHGIAVTTGLSTTGPVGFVVDSGLQWVARIDLAKMNAAGGADADDSSVTLDGPTMAPFVTYLDATTKE
jgi:hypothetical protein